jgi:predicted transcriptional regulator of viral defense system
VRALRDELAARHREVVSMLERMRLDLLRLHAGAMSVDGVTTQLGLAKDVAQEVRRLLEARGELERFLKP